MLGSDSKIRVGILGATGNVGLALARLLKSHPWFELTAVVASEKSQGKPFGDTGLILTGHSNQLPCSLLFSALDHPYAKEVEENYAKEGYVVVSNARSHRMGKNIPLMIPEVNENHLDWLHNQETKGKIVTVPNCSTVGLALALKPLSDLFGIEAVHVVTMQAISGAGRSAKDLDIEDNIIPFIKGEEEKMESETKKILGLDFGISAQCNRVPVSDGHTASVAIKFKNQPAPKEIISAWRGFKSPLSQPVLPSGVEFPLRYFDEIDFPQPKKHRLLERGMAVSLGSLRPCPLFHNKFTLLSHNLLRGAAGGAVLTAELLVRKGFIYW